MSVGAKMGFSGLLCRLENPKIESLVLSLHVWFAGPDLWRDRAAECQQVVHVVIERHAHARHPIAGQPAHPG